MQPREVFWILTPLSSLSRDSLRGHLMPGNWKKKTFVQTIFQILTWKALLIIKNMFTMKNLTDFRKTMETGVDPRLDSMLAIAGLPPSSMSPVLIYTPGWIEAKRSKVPCLGRCLYPGILDRTATHASTGFNKMTVNCCLIWIKNNCLLLFLPLRSAPSECKVDSNPRHERLQL